MANIKLSQCLASLILAASLLTSCIGFKSNKVTEASLATPTLASKKKLKVYADFSYYTSLAQYGAKEDATYKQMLNQAIADSNCCVIVEDKKSADLVLEASFYDESSKWAAVFYVTSAYTLFILPSWLNNKSRVTAVAKLGKTEKKYEVSDSMLTARWLPFAFAMPFAEKSVSQMEKEMNLNLYRTLIAEMKKDGMIR